MRGRIFAVVAVLSLVILTLGAWAEEPWDHSLKMSLTGNQTALSHWAGGGEEALAWSVSIVGKSLYEDEGQRFDTRYKMQFGGTRQGENPYRKTDDRIEAETTVTWLQGRFVNPYVGLGARTQIAAGHKYNPKREVSAFFDPAYLTQSAGIGFDTAKGVRSKVGIAMRETVTDKHTSYADGESFKWDGGVESIIDIDRPVGKLAHQTARINLFVPLNDPDARTVGLEYQLSVDVMRYLTVQLQLRGENDPRAREGWQIREGLTAGVQYSFL